MCKPVCRANHERILRPRVRAVKGGTRTSVANYALMECDDDTPISDAAIPGVDLRPGRSVLISLWRSARRISSGLSSPSVSAGTSSSRSFPSSTCGAT